MSISRRDTIIIAVLVNAGLLVVLLMTAMNFEEEHPVIQGSAVKEVLVSAQTSPQELGEEISLVSSQATPVSEAGRDNVIPTYSTTHVEEQISIGGAVSEPIQEEVSSMRHDTESMVVAKQNADSFTEITVKKGDFLEKIAKANGTTIEELKRMNRLSTDRLDVGQVLKVPVSQKTSSSTNKTTLVSTSSNPPSSPKKASAEATYYVVKSGDNPWKIAKQFQVKYEDILRLNNLNEEKAKNLKIGDRIRVK